MRQKIHPLMTEAGEALKGAPWQEYPRPQLVRDSYYNLNGLWDFAVTSGEEAPARYFRKILVPFAPQSQLSGLAMDIPDGSYLWYKRTFTLPEEELKERVLLHIGAADQVARVYVNGYFIAEHQGGYLEMICDIASALVPGENELVIRVFDKLGDYIYPYGKQTLTRGGMWYTPVSGIWKSVWIESVPQDFITRIEMEHSGDVVKLVFWGCISGGTVTLAGKTYMFDYDTVEIPLEAPRFWSPEDPYLYEFTVQAGKDEVKSYFALRTISKEVIGGIPRICLNGKPYFFHGLLDQGYWSDGLLTPASPSCYAEEIKKLKALGFNTLRKHIKIEDERFYYECDRLGMVVFQDMVQNGAYSFFTDTALPTAGGLKRDDTKMHTDPATRKAFIRAMDETVLTLKAHPCICYWTIFNEGWGQFDSSAMYERLKALDDTRLIDSASGWFLGGRTDVESRHVYFRNPKSIVSDKPFVLSEFGGYAWKPAGHCFNTTSTYAYGAYRTREDLVKAFVKLYEKHILQMIPKGLCAAIYTQVSDVEDETNGIFSYDRKVQKILPEEFAAVSQKLKDAMAAVEEGR